MQAVKMLSEGIMPLLLAIIIGYGLVKKVNVFEAFLDGAKEGLKTAADILPALVGLIAAITMLRTSGALDFISRLLAPVTNLFGIPSEVIGLALLRPVSGSGALALINDLFSAHGPDSMVGRIASVMMGSTETTFYTLAVYCGSIGIKDSRFSVYAALVADFVGFASSCFVCRWFFA